MSRINYNTIREVVDDWNKYHEDLTLTSYASLGNCSIGVLGEHGAIDAVLISASTYREALEMFNCWKSGYRYGKECK